MIRQQQQRADRPTAVLRERERESSSSVVLSCRVAANLEVSEEGREEGEREGKSEERGGRNIIKEGERGRERGTTDGRTLSVLKRP